MSLDSIPDAIATVREIARASGREVAPDLQIQLISGGKSNLTYRVRNGDERWILRRPPLGDVVRGAHDVAREYRVMTALGTTDFPVPETVGLLDPAPTIDRAAYVMAEVDGRVLRTRSDVEVLTLPERARLADSLVRTLATLHSLNPESVGLADLGRPDGFLQRQLERWSRQLVAVSDRELGGVSEVVTILQKHLPPQSPAGIVHGDYRLDNVMVSHSDPSQIVAVLDWEMATIGDPLADLGMLLMFWDEPGRGWNPITNGLMAFEGMPSAREAAQVYMGARGLTGHALAWYVLFAQFKLAVIMEQIAVRYRRGQTEGDGFDGVDSMPQTLLDQGLATWNQGRFS